MIGRIGRVRRQQKLTRIQQTLRNAHDPNPRTTEHCDFRFRVKLHPIFTLIKSGDGLKRCAFAIKGRVALVLRLVDRLLQGGNNMLRCRLVGISAGQINDIDSSAAV
ncbi:hypothetical protein D3C75_637150 [compost metagenome]